MTVAIRRADLESDRDLLIENLRRYLTAGSDGRRFDWLYRSNPHGKASVWIATDSENGEFVGMVTGFPRLMYVGSDVILVWVLGDFCVGDRYRSLGPALRLQRKCLEEVDSGAVPFCYDLPNRAMLAVYKRMGISPSGQMIRLAKVLRVDKRVEAVFGNPVLARWVSRVGNWLLGAGASWNSSIRRDASVAIAKHEKECGEEFSDLARVIGDRYGMCIWRTAEYLNWRYFANTYCHYELLTARRNGKLVAYAFFTQSGDEATLSDMFGAAEPGVIGSLVDGVVATLRERQVATVSVPIGDSHPWAGVFRRLGFMPREATPVISYFSSGGSLSGGPDRARAWFLMHGDRDS